MDHQFDNIITVQYKGVLRGGEVRLEGIVVRDNVEQRRKIGRDVFDAVNGPLRSLQSIMAQRGGAEIMNKPPPRREHQLIW